MSYMGEKFCLLNSALNPMISKLICDLSLCGDFSQRLPQSVSAKTLLMNVMLPSMLMRDELTSLKPLIYSVMSRLLKPSVCLFVPLLRLLKFQCFSDQTEIMITFKHVQV